MTQLGHRCPPAGFHCQHRRPGVVRRVGKYLPRRAACTIITLTLCVTTSCSSLAMRARSSSMARRVAASCSARSRRIRSLACIALLKTVIETSETSTSRAARRHDPAGAAPSAGRCGPSGGSAGPGWPEQPEDSSGMTRRCHVPERHGHEHARRGHAQQRRVAEPAVCHRRGGGENHGQEGDIRGVPAGHEHAEHQHQERCQRKAPARRERHRRDHGSRDRPPRNRASRPGRRPERIQPSIDRQPAGRARVAGVAEPRGGHRRRHDERGKRHIDEDSAPRQHSTRFS